MRGGICKGGGEGCGKLVSKEKEKETRWVVSEDVIEYRLRVWVGVKARVGWIARLRYLSSINAPA